MDAKFSTDQNFISIQRSNLEIELTQIIEAKTFMMACKKSSDNRILGFFWTYANNLLIVTSQSIEIYQIVSKQIKKINIFNVSVKWFIYNPRNRILVTASGKQENQLQAYCFKQDDVFKLPKLDIPLKREILSQKHIYVNQIYNLVYYFHVDLKSKMIVLYKLSKDSVENMGTLDIATDDPVSLSFVDSIIVVHNLTSKISLLFDLNDIQIPLNNKKKNVFYPLCGGLQIAPFIYEREGKTQIVETYRNSWEFLSPYFIIDRDTGFLWKIRLNLKEISLAFSYDHIRLVQFLLRRAKSKQLLLDSLKTIIENRSSLSVLSKIFDIFADILMKDAVERDDFLPNSQPQNSSPQSNRNISFNEVVLDSNEGRRTKNGLMIIQQIDMYNHVFSLIEEQQLNQKYFVSVLTEYIRSLSFKQIEVQHFIYGLVISLLVKNKRFYQLHQFLQYHVVSDSEPIACQLLSISKEHPPTGQLALDMFKRLTTSEYIVDTLLGQLNVLSALRYVRLMQIKVDPNRFMEVALQSKDEMLFFTVFKFFEVSIDKRKVLIDSKYIDIFKEKSINQK
eukprot:TRINITY_DN16659_c0_g1_i1.p1 TRINITY_DN16659_c0_g1~~TRINITY_DN16659_c0_g1_i1.p1  ORF type:complete len:636 (+),score=129.50 TRINITY_DN16659_c0_g1_i1:222-1910(+)